MKRFFLSLCLLVVLALAGCGGHNTSGTFDSKDHAAVTNSLDNDDAWLEEAYEAQLVPDPLEGWNRAMFVFNDGMITYVARPVNTAYTTVTPEFFRKGIGNFFNNLLFPVRFVNNLLQGKGQQADC